YVAFGPIFPSTPTAIPRSPRGLERIAEWKRLVGSAALVAIGGLTPERARAVLAAGADSAAVVTDIVRHPRPDERAREWAAAVEPETRSIIRRVRAVARAR